MVILYVREKKPVVIMLKKLDATVKKLVNWATRFQRFSASLIYTLP
jgi:hypothetical protein